MSTIMSHRRERGSGFFIIILLVAGLAALGISLLTLTSMGPKMSGGLRSQEEAFNAAEAGFNAAQALIKGYFSGGSWVNFDGHYLTAPSNIGLPFISGVINPSYFRRMTDEEIILALDPEKDGTTIYAPLLAFQQTFATTETVGETDTRLTYTAFLINDEAAGGAADPNDVLMVVIGVVRSGTRILASTRLEIVLQYTAGS